MSYRVIQWSTGNVGTFALRCIVGHPELELAGVWAHSTAKAGKDAGELCGLCERWEEIRILEIINYATYNQPQVLFETMGFGKPLDHTPLLLTPGTLAFAWGGTIRLLAEGLGVELEDIRQTYEKRPATR